MTSKLRCVSPKRKRKLRKKGVNVWWSDKHKSYVWIMGTRGVSFMHKALEELAVLELVNKSMIKGV